MEQFGLDDVQIFVRVVESGGFSAAARVLGVPKSTVSRKVAGLEARLGVRLLQRTTRSVRATDVGQIYFERARRALVELSEAHQFVRNVQSEPAGTLRLSTPADFPADVLAATVCEYTAKYPQVSVYVEMTQRVVDLVAEGFDLAIRAGRLSESSLVGVKIGTGCMAPYASPAYVEGHGEPESPEALPRHRCLLFGTSLERVWRLSSKGRTAEVLVRGAMASNDFSYLTSAAVGGSGIAMLPSLLAQGHQRQGRLRRVLPSWSGDQDSSHIVYPSSRHLAASARAFIDLARVRLSPVLIDSEG